jgi:8-oxo-dGTP pyrophosphatase MutT (NUDIX family)
MEDVIHMNNNNESRDIIYEQSAVIPFQLNKNNIRILLITSLSTKQWIFPKGIIEENMSAQESARNEAREEAGVDGEVLDILLGEYSYNKWGGTCHVKVFPLHVTKTFDQWPESFERKRQWVTLKKAIALVKKGDLKKLLQNFEMRFESIQALVTT